MAQNDLVLLDTLIEKYKAVIGERLDPSETFESFCFEQVLKELEPTYEEIDTGWTDGKDDGGIDGFFISVDGLLIDEATQHVSGRAPKIQVDIFTVKSAPTFELKPVNDLLISLTEVLDLAKEHDEIRYPFNERVIHLRDLFKDLLKSLISSRPELDIRIWYCSRGDASIVADNIKGRAQQLLDRLKELFSNVSVCIEFIGATELLELSRKQKTQTLPIKFTENYISRGSNNYVILVSLSEYYKFIVDESGELRRYLFESNVRDYLGSTKVNVDIASSLVANRSLDQEDFWWLNNGVTILATHANIIGKEIHLENVQIVNGLQTTETIYRHFHSLARNEDDARAVLIKIVLTSDEATRARIIKATNYQSTVELSSLRGLDKIQRDIEAYLFDHGWFYDRRRNLYKNQGRTPERIVSITYLAAAVRAVALGDPALSQRQRSKSLNDDRVYEAVFNPNWDLAIYLASLQITNAVENVISRRRLLGITPPISLVHYIAYVYTCSQIGRAKYGPNEVASLLDFPPSPENVLQIRESLAQASNLTGKKGNSFMGIILTREFIENYVAKMF